jgi:purine catabolism regulator
VDNTHVGYLLVSESPGPLQESDLIILENAIPFFAAEFQRRGEAGQAWESLRGDLLLDLLRDGMSEHCVNQARLLGYRLDEQYVVAIFYAGSDVRRLDSPHRRKGVESSAEQLLAAVRAEFQSPPYSVRPVLSAVKDSFVVALAPSDLQADQWNGMHRVLAARFPNTPVTVSTSEPFQGMAGIQAAFRNGLWMLRAAIQLGRVGCIVTSGELGVYRLLATVNRPEDLVEFALDTLGGLLGEGPKHNPDLLPTLDVHLQNACRLHEAARSLVIHPHTLRYRIDRIEEILGHSVNDPAWREEAQLALAIARVEFPRLFESS